MNCDGQTLSSHFYTTFFRFKIWFPQSASLFRISDFRGRSAIIIIIPFSLGRSCRTKLPRKETKEQQQQMQMHYHKRFGCFAIGWWEFDILLRLFLFSLFVWFPSSKKYQWQTVHDSQPKYAEIFDWRIIFLAHAGHRRSHICIFKRRNTTTLSLPSKQSVRVFFIHF